MEIQADWIYQCAQQISILRTFPSEQGHQRAEWKEGGWSWSLPP